jgi:hypothetical protein
MGRIIHAQPLICKRNLAFKELAENELVSALKSRFCQKRARRAQNRENSKLGRKAVIRRIFEKQWPLFSIQAVPGKK